MNGAKKKSSLTKLLSLSEQLITKPKWYKSVSNKHEDFSVRLKLIHNEAQVIKNTLQLKDKDITALDTATQLLVKKQKMLTKELQKVQKGFVKKRAEIQEKLLVPMETTECSSKTLFDATKENCKKIEEMIKTSKAMLDEDCKISNECDLILKPLLQKLAKLLLSQTVENCTNTSLGLKERLEAIVKSTSDMTVEDTPPQFSPVVVKKSLTMLRDCCSSNIKLLDLVNINIKKVFPEGDIKADSKEDKKEDKQETRKPDQKEEGKEVVNKEGLNLTGKS